MLTPREILAQVKDAIRNPVTFPGLYPVYTVMRDGDLLCDRCARAEYRQIVSDTYARQGWCWEALGVTVLWETEGGPIECGHCARPLVAAYGEVER